MKTTHPFAVVLTLVALGSVTARAQLSPPLDVTASLGIADEYGLLLRGNHPSAARFGYALRAGGLVQIINAGPNGVADLPKRDGSPGGDDTLFATTLVGQGIAPNIRDSGRFSASFYPPPPAGSRVFVRVFNASTLGSATRWGQSNLHVVEGVRVLDASTLGLWAVTQPLGSNPSITDSDEDGFTDLEELVANTNAGDAADRVRARALLGDGLVEIDGKAGRTYNLLRSTDELTGGMTWSVVATSGLLVANQLVVLRDPQPPASDKAFYKVDVAAP